MKKLFLIALALVTIQVTAQHKKEGHKKGDRMERMNDYTPEEMAELQTKKMTLHLDLNEAQQQKVMAINLENAKDRKSIIETRKKMKESNESEPISKEDKLKMKNDMLDKQIAMKQKMKSILDEKQYVKWEEMAAKRSEKGRALKKEMTHKKKR